MTTPLLWAVVGWKLHSGKLHKLVKIGNLGKKPTPLSSLLQNSKNRPCVGFLFASSCQTMPSVTPSPLRTVGCPATSPSECRRAAVRSYGKEQGARRWACGSNFAEQLGEEHSRVSAPRGSFPEFCAHSQQVEKAGNTTRRQGAERSSHNSPPPVPQAISWASRKLLAVFFFSLIKKAEA